jgi:sulfofructose kinase
MDERTYDVLGLGAVAVDDLLYVDDYPMPDSKTPVRAWQRAGGGLAGTALVAVARLGQKAAYGGMLDDDELSRFTLDELQKEGVNCTPVIRRAGARPYHSVIIVCQTPPGRSILFSGEGVTEPPPAAVPEALVASTKVLFVDHTIPQAAVRAARMARNCGIPVVADIERADFPQIEEYLAAVDHLIVGLDVARQLTGQTEAAACVRTLARGAHVAVVVTAGASGCWYAARGEAPQHLPAIRVPVVDTTGCGDVFHGAYAACLSWGGDVPSAVQVATIAAGLKATQPGGRAGIPDRRTIEAFHAAADETSWPGGKH